MKKSLVFGDEEQKKEKEMQKSCRDCKATSTPLWRFGPAGPKSLCNACGIRYAKKIRPDKKQANSPSPPQQIASSSSAAGTTSDEPSSSPTGPLKVRVVYSSPKGGVMFRRSLLRAPPTPAMVVKKQKYGKRKVRKLTEEEVQAARCLVALSSCSDFA